MKRVLGFVGIALFFYAFSFPLNDWFSLTMVRHQILQLPAMALLGIVAGLVYSNARPKNRSTQIAILIAAMAILLFWMLPRSIDLTIVYPWINRVMHLMVFAAGLSIAWGLVGCFFEVQIAFPLMLASMFIATGMALRGFTILLCSSFMLEEQQETGLYLIFLGLGIFVITITFLLRRLGDRE